MTIYKCISILFSVLILLSICKKIINLSSLAFRTVRTRNRSTIASSDKIKEDRDWYEEYKRNEAETRRASELEHYKYDGVYVNLDKVQSDRSKLFGAKWTNWNFNKSDGDLIAPGDYHGQCIKMFGEMSFARKVIIVKDPSFWTEDKEVFWQKICHPEITKVDIREKTLFDTRQRIIAEEAFNHDDPQTKIG